MPIKTIDQKREFVEQEHIRNFLDFLSRKLPEYRELWDEFERTQDEILEASERSSVAENEQVKEDCVPKGRIRKVGFLIKEEDRDEEV